MFPQSKFKNGAVNRNIQGEQCTQFNWYNPYSWIFAGYSQFPWRTRKRITFSSPYCVVEVWLCDNFIVFYVYWRVFYNLAEFECTNALVLDCLFFYTLFLVILNIVALPVMSRSLRARATQAALMCVLWWFVSNYFVLRHASRDSMKEACCFTSWRDSALVVA